MKERLPLNPVPSRNDGTVIRFDGAGFFVPHGHFDESSLLTGGTPEPHVMDVLRRLVCKGQTTIDVGANIGTHAVVMSRLVGDAGKVFAIEPDLDNIAALRHTIMLSGIGNIHLVCAAAAESTSLCSMIISTGSNSLFGAANLTATRHAVGVPLDAVCKEPPDFIKMDVEGSEISALRGMSSILGDARPIILMEFSPTYIRAVYGFDRSVELLRLMAGYGYSCHVINPNGSIAATHSVEAALAAFQERHDRDGWNHVELLFSPAESNKLSGCLVDCKTANNLSPLSKETYMLQPSTRYTIPNFLLRRAALPEVDVRFTPPSFAHPMSQLCTAEQMDTVEYRNVCSELQLDGNAKHRKIWEYAFIVSALRSKGMIVGQSRGLGFGTGTEPLPSFFARHAIIVLATDAPESVGVGGGWVESGQWTSGLDRLWQVKIVDEETFKRQVSYKTVDMNKIPIDLTGFDFCWSSCALEHLGSIKAGAEFIRNSMKTLREGGIAVHTTEFNLLSDTDTIDRADTCLFRKRDIEEICYDLAREGHIVAPVNFWPGSEPVDEHVDVPPFGLPHLKLRLQEFVTTSIGLIVQKGRGTV